MGTAEVMYTLWFTGPRQVEVREGPVPTPGPGQVRVRVHASAISAGTEMVAYRGQWPEDTLLDEVLEPLRRPARYPFPYGYACIGRVDAVGEGVDPLWQGRRVFVFHPHQSHVLAFPDALLPIPPEVSDEDALFYPNMETAITLVHDAAPLLGERVLVFGQGIVGLLTTHLLALFPLEELTTVDPYPLRREASRQAGAHRALAPEDLAGSTPFADISIEVSGSAQALQQALDLTRYHGKVVVGSWYGAKPVTLHLGTHFHRGRLRIVVSQVSTLDPSLRGRWDRQRRSALAWRLLSEIRPARWITHRFPITRAAGAYRQIDQHPETCLQVVLTYPDAPEEREPGPKARV